MTANAMYLMASFVMPRRCGVQVAPTLFVGPIKRLTNELSERQVASKMDGRMWRQLGNAAGIGLVFAMLILLPIWRNWRRSPVTTKRSVFGKDFGKRLSDRKSMLGWFLLGISGAFASVGGAPFAWAQNLNSETSIEVPWDTEAGDRLQQRIGLLRDRLSVGADARAIDEYGAFLLGNSDLFPAFCLKSIDGLQKLGWEKIPSDFSMQAGADGQQFVLERVGFGGYVRSAREVALSDAQKSWFQQRPSDRIYELRVESNKAAEGDVQRRELRRVFCRTVPTIWLEAKQLRQPVEIEGVRCRVAEQELGNDRSVYLTGTPRWRLGETEDEERLAPPLPDHLVALGKAGWDLVGVEAVRSHNQQKISSQESRGFMQLIRLSQDEALLRELRNLGATKLEPMQALAESDTSFGMPVRWRVRIANASVVTVENEGLANELGAGRYVQFDGFVDIGTQAVEYKVGDQAIRFEREFPVTLVAPFAQPFVSKQQAAESALAWEVGAYFEVDGLFYRLWAYQSELVKKKSDSARQASPRVVLTGMRPALAPATPSRAGEIGWFGYALAAATLVILAAILYLAGQRTVPRSAR
ncbi:MAG: hypothetical protein AAGG44_11375, partial [Planctomycetota bacterium]